MVNTISPLGSSLTISSFPSLPSFTVKDVGTHVYKVSEVQRENTEVTYDTTEYTVEVTVADAGNGKLKVSKTIKKGDYTVDAIAFENI